MDRQSMIGGGGGTPATVVGIASYTALRAGTFTGIDALILTDPTKPGLFVPAPAGSRDNGGTVIHDAGGNLWAREFSGRVNAGWFYDCAGHYFGDGSKVTITNLDVEANPQWIGLADDGYVGGPGSVQIAEPYPVGTYWDFVALQEWVYACAAERSIPQATFVGSITGAILTVSEWLSGGALGVGQQIIGASVQPGTYVTDGFGGDTYGVGQLTNTAGFVITTATSTFRGFVEGSLLTVDAFYTGPPISYGDVILSPLNPPAGQYNGVLPGTTILTQVRQVGAAGGLGDYNVGVVQASVPSEQMAGSGGPNWNSSGNNNNLNLKGEVPRGLVSLNQMLVINGNGLDLSMGSAKLATTMFWYGNATGTVPTGPAIKFNSLAYGYVENLTVTDLSGVVGYLVSLSHVAGVPGLNVENNTFRDWVIGGNLVSSECGIAVSPEGGSAQGDTQTFIDCWVTGFLDGWLIGGDNAIAVTFFGGQTQSCPRKGINDAGGSFGSFNFLTENNTTSYYLYPQQNQINLGGADFWCQQVGTEASLSMGTRSESLIGMIDLNRSSSLHNWTCGGSIPAWKANQHWLPGFIIAAGTIFTQDDPEPTNPNWGFYGALLADDGGWPWFESDPSSTPTHIVNPNSPGWTVNEWVGGGCWFRNGPNGYCSDTSIIASDANSITLSSPSGYSTPTWCKVFKLAGAAQPNWAACPRFGVMPRNESGYGATIAAGFNLISSPGTLEGVALAGDWVSLPGAAVVAQPGAPPMVGPLVGRIENHTAAVTGYFIQAFGDVATIWGAPTGPIHLGTFPSALGFNPLVGQLSGTPSGVGTYQLEFGQTVGSQFTGSITGNELQVTAVQQGALSVGDDIGGAGIAVSPLSIASLGALITGYIDNGAGAAGTTLTVQSVIGGTVQLGAPVTTNIGPALSANSVVYQQLTGPAGGVGTYSISTEDGLPQLAGSASFNGSVAGSAGNVLTTTGTTGKVVIGMLLLGPSVPAGTWITYQASGSPGGDGTYYLSNGGMSIAAEAMTTTWSLSVGGHAATFVGHIDDGAGGFGNLLTVTSITSGKLDVGQTVNVPVTGGVAGQTQTMAINGKGTGTGGVGTYTVSGNAVLIASHTMTANTTGGVGFYVLDATLGSPISSEAMTAGPASVTQPTWALQDVHGNPQNAAVTQVDQPGYWSAPIADGPLTWMAIDFDQLFGVGSVRQCQLNLGKITNCTNVDLPAQSVFGQLQGQFIRPSRGPTTDFSYHGGKQPMYSAPTTALAMSANPFEMPAGGFFAGGVGSQPTITALAFNANQTIDMPLMGSGLSFDQDILIQPEYNFPGGGIITWGANVKAPTATINIGDTNGVMVRMKWVGNNYATASGITPGGTWYVTSVAGPYP